VIPVTAGASLAELWPSAGAGLSAAIGREAAARALAAEPAS
jgi:hypothetical protein